MRGTTEVLIRDTGSKEMCGKMSNVGDLDYFFCDLCKAVFEWKFVPLFFLFLRMREFW